MTLMLPIVTGRIEGTVRHATLCTRIDEHGATHRMWYVGDICHDEVNAVRTKDGRLIQTELPSHSVTALPAPGGGGGEDET